MILKSLEVTLKSATLRRKSSYFKLLQLASHDRQTQRSALTASLSMWCVRRVQKHATGASFSGSLPADPTPAWCDLKPTAACLKGLLSGHCGDCGTSVRGRSALCSQGTSPWSSTEFWSLCCMHTAVSCLFDGNLSCLHIVRVGEIALEGAGGEHHRAPHAHGIRFPDSGDLAGNSILVCTVRTCGSCLPIGRQASGPKRCTKVNNSGAVSRSYCQRCRA